MDRKKVIEGLECHQIDKDHRINCSDCPYHCDEFMNGLNELHNDALALLKEQDERLRKLQKDKDKLCIEVSEWKHKFHDAPPKFVPQGVVDQICWERDVALLQLEQIGKGLGSKMDDIVAMLKEQESKSCPKQVKEQEITHRDPAEAIYSEGKAVCPVCGVILWESDNNNYCGFCGQRVMWE